jgi:ATP-dependent DNA helicase RecG
MLTEELKEIIQSLSDAQTDTSFVEIKACVGGFPKRIWETISAFANTPGGGVIILGVEEKADRVEVVGVKDAGKFQKDLGEICARMQPPVRALIEIHKFEGKSIVTAEIPEVSFKDKPCYYQGSGMISGACIRVADGDRRLTQYEVQGFLDGRGQPQYDIEPIPGTSRQDLNQNALKLFLQHIRDNNAKIKDWSDGKILQTYRVLVSKDGKEVATLAGVLCFGLYPQQFFPGIVTHVIAYPENEEGKTGTVGERFLDNVKIEGSLLSAAPDIIKTIKKNIQKRSMIKGLFREDVLEYPEVFLREAVINALGHRDYSPLARGTAVQVKIFPSRIEIVSPGGLFGPVTVDRLGESGLQATRNSHLMKLLEDSPVPNEGRVLCENRGTGIPSMIDALRRAGMEPPRFSNFLTQFKVECSNQALFDKTTLSWLEQFVDVDLNDRKRFALAYIYHNEQLTNADYCRMNECDSRVASKELGDLVGLGLLLQHGTRRWAFYTLPLKKAAVKEAPSGKRRADRGQEILAVIKKRGECSRQELEEILELSGPGVAYWLRIMLRNKMIELTTKSINAPGVKYRVKMVAKGNN